MATVADLENLPPPLCLRSGLRLCCKSWIVGFFCEESREPVPCAADCLHCGRRPSPSAPQVYLAPPCPDSGAFFCARRWERSRRPPNCLAAESPPRQNVE